MEQKKQELILQVLKENLSLSAEQIPIIFNKIGQVESMDDTEFDTNPILGREIKERIIKSLQHQMGFLAGLQSETVKFMNMLDSDVEQLEVWVKTTIKDNEKFKGEIQNNINEIPNV